MSERGRHADPFRSEYQPRRHDNAARLHFFPLQTKIGAGFDFIVRKFNPRLAGIIGRFAHMLKGNNRVGPFGHRCPRHDAQSGSRRVFAAIGHAGIGDAFNRQPCEAVSGQRASRKSEAVHGGIIEGRYVVSRIKGFGKYAPQCIPQRQPLFA